MAGAGLSQHADHLFADFKGDGGEFNHDSDHTHFAERRQPLFVLSYGLSISTMIHPALFYTVSALTVASALGVILARRPIYAVLSLVLVLFGLSTLFVALHAFFVAAIQIVVYAGAVLVLFLFVVMLLDMAPEALLRARNKTM